MQPHRIFVEKSSEFQVEAQSLKNEFNENLSLSLHSLRLLIVYDLFGFTDALLEKCRYTVFGETVTDRVTDDCPLEGKRYLAVEFIPGQFDQRASSAVDCVHLIDPEADVQIRSARLLIFDDDLSDTDLEAIRNYYINKVEAREKNLALLAPPGAADVRPLATLDGFTEMPESEFAGFCRRWGLAMNTDDLREVVRYFRAERRNPTETELRILDTYWSDHCRHTTFTTALTGIRIEDSFLKCDIEATLEELLAIRRELGRDKKDLCLMELATIGARYLRKKGLLDDMEQSEENNACSIYVNVDVDGRTEKWLLQFKNETHNHPTEIEPFGGASTCLGGAIRDPLSGRAYVYQAMRVTGAGDICRSVAETLPGKLPQRVITRKAAAGYSSYGNQIGLATTHVREIFHEGYTAKRMEVGAVVGAVKADAVRRESPAPGDRILLLGGRTGRDGIGGATGASKEHNEASLETCGSEVQKGNAPEERKLQRLFRRKEVTCLIKKSNDFGAGGVSVAIGELAPGLDIWLERVPAKYSGLNPMELAISESQERMAVVIEAKDLAEFIRYCGEENIEVTEVAEVTDRGRMRIFHRNETVADLSREFIDSAGARHMASALIMAPEESNPFRQEPAGRTLEEKLCSLMGEANVASQKGMVEMFDSTVGRSTVLMPYGGARQATETQVSVQKLPVDGHTETASMMAFGYNPYLSSWSPYHGAAYAVVEACAKVTAAGGDFSRMRFSYQEYFEKMTSERSWGKPLAALLGTLKMQLAFGLPAIGGKDSMSGTFEHLNVPPTLIAFGVTTVDARKVISPEFKQAGHSLWMIDHRPLSDGMPDTEQLQENWRAIREKIEAGEIVAAWALGFGGLAEALAKMGFGNNLGAEVSCSDAELFDNTCGSILVEATGELSAPCARRIGSVIAEPELRINGETIALETLERANEGRYDKIYPAKVQPASVEMPAFATDAAPAPVRTYPGAAIEHPRVYIPVFPGTNCDYDTAKAFREAGAEVRLGVFCNLTAKDVQDSIARMKRAIDDCQILVFAGGFSSGDEPDGSGKFIANVLNNKEIAESINGLLARDGLILGICNGFQALVKSGLLPFGKLGCVTPDSPTLFRNDINRHVSQMVTTRVASVNSPWLRGMKPGQLHAIAVSHGEGKFVVSEALARQLFAAGQVAFQYADPQNGKATMESPFNPNGSCCAIEGIISPDGQILGKMGHTERYEPNLFKNIYGEKVQPLFRNAVEYFRKTKE
ncbi:MAG: phosphoribosylformylglycinamidine synthase [Bacteroidales bacterium]|nr:phosphoribosylformylglycinamidine synthase [Bacteroidales bacterium]